MSAVGTPKTAEQIQRDWDTNPRWRDVTRTYTAQDVVALQGSVVEEFTLARRGAEVLWEQLHDLEWVNALGALTGNMAVQQVRAGLKAIYLSGWQVAGDANLSGHTYPDQSLYPANSVPQVVRRINNALQRADQIAKIEGDTSVQNWLAPIVADAEGRLRWRAQRLRAAEGLDRRRRGRHPLGGPAGLREEVRPSGRQGADPDPAAHPHADGCSARGRRG